MGGHPSLDCLILEGILNCSTGIPRNSRTSPSSPLSFSWWRSPLQYLDGHEQVTVTLLLTADNQSAWQSAVVITIILPVLLTNTASLLYNNRQSLWWSQPSLTSRASPPDNRNKSPWWTLSQPVYFIITTNILLVLMTITFLDDHSQSMWQTEAVSLVVITIVILLLDNQNQFS